MLKSSDDSLIELCTTFVLHLTGRYRHMEEKESFLEILMMICFKHSISSCLNFYVCQGWVGGGGGALEKKEE